MLRVAIGQQVVAGIGIGAVGLAFDHRQHDLTVLAKDGCIFAATGVTEGSLLNGVKRLKGGTMTTESVVMRASSGTVRWVRGEHRKPR